MKNKLLTYGLLVAVLGVWGYIVYRVVATTRESDILPVHTSRNHPVSKEDLSYYEQKDSLSLSLSYRDPMWNGTLEENDEAVTTDDMYDEDQMGITRPVAQEPEIQLAYLGYVENEKTQKKVAIVDVQGRQHLIGTNENREGVKVLRIEDDHIVVQYKQTHKTIYK